MNVLEWHFLFFISNSNLSNRDGFGSKNKQLRQCWAKSQYAVAQLAGPAMDTSVQEAAKSHSAIYLLSNQSHSHPTSQYQNLVSLHTFILG